jgi:multiple sugar transport system permease protein
MTLFVVFEAYPLLQTFILSFEEWSLVKPPEPVGLDNYRELFDDRVFWKAIRNTFFFALGVVPATLAISLFLAVLIFPLGRRLQTFFKAAFYLPAVASLVVVSLIWRWLYDPAYGLINYILETMGLAPLKFLASSTAALPSIMVMVVTVSIGGALILLLAAMNGIPTELYETAILDGANAWQKFWNITLPLIRPTILFLVVIGTIAAFQEFTTIFIMTSAGPGSGSGGAGGGPNYATTTMVFYIFRLGFRFNRFGVASALAVVLFGIIFVVAYIQFRLLRSEIEY